jgi:hypothetical protein
MLRRRRRVCVTAAVLFVLLQILSSDWHYAMENSRRGGVEADADHLAIHADAFSLNHEGMYPRSIADLAASDIRVKSAQDGLEYFGAGLNKNSSPEIVVVASIRPLVDGSHVLITKDEHRIWVGPVGFPIIHHFLIDHVPVTEWKNQSPGTMP